MPVWVDGDRLGSRLVVAESADRLAEILGFFRDRRLIRVLSHSEIEILRDALGERVGREIGSLLRKLVARLAPEADVEFLVGRPSLPWRKLDPTEFVFLIENGIRRPIRVAELERGIEGILALRGMAADDRLHWIRT